MAAGCTSSSCLTDSDLTQTYSGIQPGVLPSTPNGSSDRTSNGMLTPNAINSVISSLKSSGVLPTASISNPEAYVKNVATLLNTVQSEYQFYEIRYKYALEKLFGAIRQGYMLNSVDTQNVIKKYLSYTLTLNRRLNDLTQIINEISMDMLSGSDKMSEEIEKFNKRVQEQKGRLEEQNKIISSSEATTKIRKEMVKFTEEKAKRSDNLLKLYSVLNIVALGLLVYVYKAADE
jgi:hypothetical protein